MLFWTRHANLRRVENYIYDPSARINKNPLNSTTFWTRRDASTQLCNASTQLCDVSTQLCDASTQLCDASNFTLKYSSIIISTKRHLNSATRQKRNYDPNGLPYNL